MSVKCILSSPVFQVIGGKRTILTLSTHQQNKRLAQFTQPVQVKLDRLKKMKVSLHLRKSANEGLSQERQAVSIQALKILDEGFICQRNLMEPKLSCLIWMKHWFIHHKTLQTLLLNVFEYERISSQFMFHYDLVYSIFFIEWQKLMNL